ncbi:VOC family protein [Novosphingobium sp.]|uniref:VOC family protein n=1 Tax=Novosphingobium sp. TaxID=1874826 RepID=UPI00260852F1|nr:VOC family protein [Novosphingobium sp.]
MFTHIMLGTNDIAKAKTFYDAIFAAAGGPAGTATPDGKRIMYSHKGGILIITTPINGQPACAANGGTIGLHLDSPEMVDAWWAAGQAAGGTACEDPPGVRPTFNMYLAYLRDPDGNKLCGTHPLG